MDVKSCQQQKKNLYRAYLIVDIKIDDVEVEQNFFVWNQRSYLIILRQPYIIAIKMETKMLDDYSYYARIYNYDDKRSM